MFPTFLSVVKQAVPEDISARLWRLKGYDHPKRRELFIERKAEA